MNEKIKNFFSNLKHIEIGNYIFVTNRDGNKYVEEYSDQVVLGLKLAQQHQHFDCDIVLDLENVEKGLNKYPIGNLIVDCVKHGYWERIRFKKKIFDCFQVFWNSNYVRVSKNKFNIFIKLDYNIYNDDFAKILNIEWNAYKNPNSIIHSTNKIEYIFKDNPPNDFDFFLDPKAETLKDEPTFFKLYNLLLVLEDPLLDSNIFYEIANWKVIQDDIER